MWLRNFTFNQIQAHFKEQNSKNSGTSTDDMSRYKDIFNKADINDPSKSSSSRNQSKKPPTKYTVPNFVKKASKK